LVIKEIMAKFKKEEIVVNESRLAELHKMEEIPDLGKRKKDDGDNGNKPFTTKEAETWGLKHFAKAAFIPLLFLIVFVCGFASHKFLTAHNEVKVFNPLLQEFQDIRDGYATLNQSVESSIEKLGNVIGSAKITRKLNRKNQRKQKKAFR